MHGCIYLENSRPLTCTFNSKLEGVNHHVLETFSRPIIIIPLDSSTRGLGGWKMQTSPIRRRMAFASGMDDSESIYLGEAFGGATSWRGLSSRSSSLQPVHVLTASINVDDSDISLFESMDGGLQ